ncbi:Amino acid/polyamine transporter I [Penicillium hispanicum]|uniref:Amino acid/polyamine transporter I n=1 Tax=Penicillium hispanicum TaxID=1080232 RepID=UPI002541BCBF|nr:Amino acid/polyamine transporter I [Penicillium hispanicum]KAJ5594680.1 Amino acid/polyamine transporter I [Penicillium hispanicum]
MEHLPVGPSVDDGVRSRVLMPGTISTKSARLATDLPPKNASAACRPEKLSLRMLFWNRMLYFQSTSHTKNNNLSTSQELAPGRAARSALLLPTGASGITTSAANENGPRVELDVTTLPAIARDKINVDAVAYRAPARDADTNSFKFGGGGSRSDEEIVSDPFAAPLKRQLKSRHLQMIAIGGIIGPGLLVSSGNALHEGGPGGALISFCLVGIIVFFVMQSLGEMATIIPVTGSFTEYAARFVDDSLAFALGWAYWYLWVTVLANEYNSISLVIGYWTEAVPQWGWILIFWFLFLGLSNLGILAYGEMEFWLSLIKVLALIVFFILAICISAGGIGPQTIGFKYWHHPGAFADSINGVAKTFVVAGTLYAGTEMVGITAGESKNPAKAVPRAIKQVFWRILIFYVGTIFFIGMLIPWNDKRLLGSTSKTASSPLTIALSDAGILPAAHLINALIVISVISAGNSSLYVASRTLLFMSRNGKAPRFIGRTNRAGVPWVGLIFTNVFACIVFLEQSSSAGTVYSALITLSGVATFIVWATIGICHIRFRRALVVQGQDPSKLPYQAWLYPWGTYLSLAANVFLVFFQGYTCFLNPFSSTDFVINYILLPVFALFVVVYKVWNKTQWVRLEDMDIWTGRREIADVEEAPVDKPRRWWSRLYSVVVG